MLIILDYNLSSNTRLSMIFSLLHTIYAVSRHFRWYSLASGYSNEHIDQIFKLYVQPTRHPAPGAQISTGNRNALKLFTAFHFKISASIFVIVHFSENIAYMCSHFIENTHLFNLIKVYAILLNLCAMLFL